MKVVETVNFQFIHYNQEEKILLDKSKIYVEDSF
jgi:hypothetical protein